MGQIAQYAEDIEIHPSGRRDLRPSMGTQETVTESSQDIGIGGY